MSLVRTVMLRVPAGAAKPGPAIGQALGPLGVNMAEFCKQFNDKSKDLIAQTPCPVKLQAFSDRTFKFEIRTPPTSELIKMACGITLGSAAAGGRAVVGRISPQAVYEIAKIKQSDEYRSDEELEGIAKGVVGTARSMGVLVTEDFASKLPGQEDEEDDEDLTDEERKKRAAEKAKKLEEEKKKKKADAKKTAAKPPAAGAAAPGKGAAAAKPAAKK